MFRSLVLGLLLVLRSVAFADEFEKIDIRAMRDQARQDPAVAGAAVNSASGLAAGADAGSPGCVYDGKDKVGTLRMLFEFIRHQAGFRPESDWVPVLQYFGASSIELEVLEDYGLTKAIAMSYDPGVEINASGDHAVMITPRVFEVACKGNEVGWVVAHELAHHRLGHMTKLKELKMKLWPPWGDLNKGRFVGVCEGLSQKDTEYCFKNKIFSVFVAETPEITAAAKAQELEADIMGNDWMTKINPSYTKDNAKAVLDRIKEYERREGIPPSKFYDSPEVRALNINRRASR